MTTNNNSGKTHYRRFDTFSSFLHLLVIISFLLLALTGMMIKFAGMGIFQVLFELMGGYPVTGLIHRFAAIITFTYFGLHIYSLLKKKKSRGIKFRDLLRGENSLMPNRRDWSEFVQTTKWFLGLGPRPAYGKWTYWEKFDYLAVFWGVAIIGATGLLLWFPEFFTGLGVPGKLINIATIIHSDEALLATGFIFTVHFFNTHFRPDKFPMDTVIFTGRVSVEELKKDRPREYEQLVREGKLEENLEEAPSKQFVKAARIFGFIALALGLFLIVSIIYSMIFLYQ
ncbi:MAG: cytochrome b/b6 domain-containing protein [Bacteroidales bacterium]|nr:cytochrome b/b6 domain-containing protein [Bacteroidales bacterium]MCF8308486.1 cytochrome b/b6 domain-containing protein [Bacteroidales bacterium]